MNEVDAIRLDQFRQLKKEIRGSEEHMIVGIDVAKDKHHAFFGTVRGQTLLRRLVFENNIQGFEKLMSHVQTLKASHGLSRVVFGLEPTANYHKPLGEHLIKCGCMLVLVAGESIKKNRVLLDGRWDSHDTKDAANVADLIGQGKFYFYEYPPMPLRDLRNLLSWKRRLKKQEHGLKVRIRNHLLAQYFPELDRYFGAGGKEMLAVVKWCVAPSVMAGMAFDEFIRLVAPRDRGLTQRKKLRSIWELAVDSVGCTAGESLELESKMMVDGLLQVRETIRITRESIEKICLTFPEYNHLLSIPGFGPDVSSTVLAAIGNPCRFEKGSQVIRIAGYDLSAKRSGKTSDNAVPVISKKGKADLRYALYQAALVASTRNKYFMLYYANKLRDRARERGIKTKMRVKLAAKMLIIAWTLMKKREPFDPTYLNLN